MDFDGLAAALSRMDPVRQVGRVAVVEESILRVTGLSRHARLGDQVLLLTGDRRVAGEVMRIGDSDIMVMPYEDLQGVSRGDRVVLTGASDLAPDDSWIGRVIDPFGLPLDGAPIRPGGLARLLRAAPPDPAGREGLGARLETGMAVFNTMLPVARGQRIGLFAGSGVGKSSLIAHFARAIEADVVVIALIGERGRELRDFVQDVLGPEGMARTVVVAATSDRLPLVRRRCAQAAMTVAEHFRDRGCDVLLLADSMTRFAEAHREVATASGEIPSLRGYPPSTAHALMNLCERAGPAGPEQGAITAILSVLVAGSDMEEPVADILRGVLDGHVVLDRAIAERGRYPAIDLLRSVSRSLPGVATPDENETIAAVRQMLGTYEKSEILVRAGLYTEGANPELDRAVRAWPELDAFIAEAEANDTRNSFNRLRLILRRAGAGAPSQAQRGASRHGTGASQPAAQLPALPRARVPSGTLQEVLPPPDFAR
ncbi:FliI/YscN family ATPase [Pseudooceanicola sp. 216_PA32_1]|uniref:FliI/YscN family ATPase n=1 Tax=Pseudooceanicola pacificus TaxID=2676438 RepID=A0A844W1Q8_9RHOB|nr:FliI/YscN family ATPase [Pseudooceanicola pacificus]MWB76634.1 FliI/YscN family ATPase [Pseudooceanicola pacificus]